MHKICNQNFSEHKGGSGICFNDVLSDACLGSEDCLALVCYGSPVNVEEAKVNAKESMKGRACQN